MSKKPKPPTSEDFLKSSLDSLKDESDRAVALILAAWVEDALRGFITAFVVEDKPAHSDLFGPGRPLNMFDDKICISYVFNLIGEEMHSDLIRIRDIRNLFAHHREDIKFTTDFIAAQCKKFQLIERYNSQQVVAKQVHENRKRFVLTALLHTCVLIERAENSKLRHAFKAVRLASVPIKDDDLLEQMSEAMRQASLIRRFRGNGASS